MDLVVQLCHEALLYFQQLLHPLSYAVPLPVCGLVLLCP